MPVHLLATNHQSAALSALSTADLQQPFRLFALEKIPLIASPDDPELYAIIPCHDTVDIVEIGSRRHLDYLNQLAIQHSGGDPEAIITRDGFKDHIDFCRAWRHQAKLRRVFKRYAWLPEDDALWIDLCQPDGRCVRVTAAGWTVEVPLHPMFLRLPTQLPLPVPEPCDDGEAAFRRCLPPGLTPEAQKLLTGAILGCMIPREFAHAFAYPVIILIGDAGSGKSTLARLIKHLVDHEITALAAKPRSVDDLFVDGKGCHLLSYDNLDYVKDALSDGLCQLVTGSAVTKRRLYTDADRLIIRGHNPVLLNGINVDIPKSDLLDRSVHVHLTRIDRYDPDAANRTAAELPFVMGYFCDLLARALANYASTEVPNAPRLSLLAKLCTAAEPFGCEVPFVHLLRSTQHDALLASRDNDLVIATLFDLTKRELRWTGTYKQLLTALTNRADDATSRSPEWPATPHKLARHLREHSRLLGAQGLTVTQGRRTEAGRMVEIVRTLPDTVDDSVPF